ncbi:HTH domain-containing protein [Streptomyces niveus]|uniref:HTH domain-containing protein n=1 Tax=Streptomyces niveus TaxID=193462 RepID=UPI003419C717
MTAHHRQGDEESSEPTPIRHEGPSGFSMTPLWVVKRCRKEVWLYDFLRARYGGMQAIFPGIQTVANELEISRRTVENALARLKKQGAIEVIPRYREDGSQTSNQYLTHFHPPEERKSNTN